MPQIINQTYTKHYEDIYFDRSRLFEVIYKQYHPKNVLYPGSSFHITPAFYFHSITFIDKTIETQQFFSKKPELLEYIHRKKHYKENSKVQYMHGNYEKLHLQASYDLLLSMFSPKVIESCGKYVIKGGIVLTHNYHEEARFLINNKDWRVEERIEYHKGKYIFSEKEIIEIAERKHDARYLRSTSRGTEYIEKEKYYIIKRVN